MKREHVRSSNLVSIGYDKDTKTMEIEFHGGGIYQYFNVPAKVHTVMMRASSVGKFFHQVIKPNYSYKRVDTSMEDKI